MDLRVPLGIGTMMWGSTPLDKRINGRLLSDDEMAAIVGRAVGAGVTFFDTAEGYGGGTSEENLRRAIACCGADTASVMAASKFLPTLWRWSEGAFLRALDASNARLGVSCAPLYFIHSPIHPRALEVWVRAAATAHRQGKLRALGVSNFDADQVLRAHRLAKTLGVPLIANQVMVNLLVYKSPRVLEMLRVCKELNITVIAYATVGQGLLADGLTAEKSRSVRLTRMSGIKFDDLAVLRKTIREIADAHRATMAQVAINWAICKGVVPLVGTRSVAQLEDTLGAVSWRLSDEEVKRLDAVAMGKHLFEKPRWRRSLFVVFISALMMAYKLSAFFSRRWF